jgi:penicillin amidase
MKSLIKYLPVLVIFISCNGGREYDNQVQIQGLFDEVEVIRDEAGINHIYASNQHDLFMAQG